MSPKACSAPLYADASHTQPQPECRVAMPTSPLGADGEDDGGGLQKYKKRRGGLVSLARSRRGILAILLLLAVGFAVYQIFLSQLPG